MKFIKKFFRNEDTQGVTTIQTWRVSWYSRYDIYHTDTRHEVEVFLNEEDAKDFAKALVDAQRLLKNTDDIHIEVTKN